MIRVIVSKLVCYKKCVTALARLDSDMMSVLGLPGRPPRDQLSLCGAAITGLPGAASKAYRHDYNLLLPQIVSPVALADLPPAISRLTSHLFIQQQLTYQNFVCPTISQSTED